jgi:hypothetical protein
VSAAATAAREALVERARAKPLPPYTLDPSLTFFCPQENVEGLDHPAVRALRRWKESEWRVPAGSPRVLLLLPCQLTKPYPVSVEHLAVTRALLDAGFAPTAPGDWPDELRDQVDDLDLLSNAPLAHPSGLVVDRATISEPFGLVPYEVVYRFDGDLSPMARYDDPGLFEHRGIGCPWRGDNTSVEVRPGFWRWGDNERAAYVDAHNRLAREIAGDLERVAGSYAAIVGYVAPGMTHRSFLAGTDERRATGMPTARRVRGRNVELVGVGDVRPGLVRLAPTPAEFEAERAARGGRLTSKPLQAPAMLDGLVAALRAAA